jgi:hypothetical protein
VTSYPASEQRIWEVETGRIFSAILPMPCAQPLSVGDSITFALVYSDFGTRSGYVKDGDSVSVMLSEVTDLGTTDLATGEALFRFSWKPPGQSVPPGTIAKRVVKKKYQSSHGRG